ncbi:ubiquitin fusion degradation protein [Cladochytrium tenue]|nr:ubiquitin fusion degradation protein [Cladochytrium tenue]
MFHNDNFDMGHGRRGHGFGTYFGSGRQGFNEYYRCYSMAMMPGNEREAVNFSGKTTLNIAYPMQFQLVNEQHKEKSSHAGSIVRVKNVTLPLGHFVKLQPQSVDFLDISDPKAVLEKAISNFSALTEGDIISIKYNNKLYDILIMETKPEGQGISVVETDLEATVQFRSPIQRRQPYGFHLESYFLVKSHIL